MKNLLLTILIFGATVSLSAQRFGYVDTDYILENLPSYNDAQQMLKTQTEQWNKEIQNRQNNANKRQADFLNEKVLLTEDQIRKEQEEIDREFREIKQIQEKRYGQDGDLIKLRKSLVKPIQDQIYVAVDEVAKKRNYGFIFDKGSDLIMVYTDPKFDISREVLLLLNPNAVEKPSKGNSSNSSNGRTSNSTKKSNSSGKSTSRSGSSKSNSNNLKK
ncbi:OmpH family outer membrane protein [Moheibacter lacus]|uniref:OmpH family outer membrane protein n=1 Tax=Moheibacter lacus TaxID=2745851 RepID=A0A838ZSA5_9FLAO|nr:OmpH family outer membrane protein [Moheibacter lacus]MBA5629209.1 OmpH family outer membrane protein [Moheibacter lacus]